VRRNVRKFPIQLCSHSVPSTTDYSHHRGARESSLSMMSPVSYLLRMELPRCPIVQWQAWNGTIHNIDWRQLRGEAGGSKLYGCLQRAWLPSPQTSSLHCSTSSHLTISRALDRKKTLPSCFIASPSFSRTSHRTEQF
jgi:hypothetical protein